MILPQQLEDKKKGCNKWYGDFRCKFKNLDGTYEELCPICQAEIAILEQAIAEEKKRDKDEIELLKTIEKWICKVTPEMQLDNEILREVCPNIFYNCENRIEQLQSQQNTNTTSTNSTWKLCEGELEHFKSKDNDPNDDKQRVEVETGSADTPTLIKQDPLDEIFIEKITQKELKELNSKIAFLEKTK